MKDSYGYDIDITGTIESVTFDLGPTITVDVRTADGCLHRYEDLPAPEDADYEDFWLQYVGRKIHITESRHVAVEVLRDSDGDQEKKGS